MPKIYVSNPHKTGLGVYQSDDGELTFLVEVRKRPQSNLMTILINNKDLHRNHFDAFSAFEEISSTLNADIQCIPDKYLRKEFNFYKQELDNRKEERKRIREEKLLEQDEDIVVKVSLFEDNEFLKY